MNWMILLSLVAICTSCQFLPAEKTTKSLKALRPPVHTGSHLNDNNDYSCFEGAPQIVIYEQETNSLQYCDNGSWLPIPIKAFKKKITARNLPKKTIRDAAKEKFPTAHQVLSITEDKTSAETPKQLSSNEEQEGSFFCRAKMIDGIKSYRCKKRQAH